MARMRDTLTYYIRAPREDGSERGPGVGRILRVSGQHHGHVEREGEGVGWGCHGILWGYF